MPGFFRGKTEKFRLLSLRMGATFEKAATMGLAAAEPVQASYSVDATERDVVAPHVRLATHVRPEILL